MTIDRELRLHLIRLVSKRRLRPKRHEDYMPRTRTLSRLDWESELVMSKSRNSNPVFLEISGMLMLSVSLLSAVDSAELQL